jgi:hypothetical protein
MPDQERIAVVAVHGVADQQPGESARRVADLLLDLGRHSPELYADATEQHLRISVAPAPGLDGPAPAGAADVEFMRDALAGYEPPDPPQSWESVRLDTSRCGRKVDIYEYYWADLSRLGTGYARIFGDLYGLLLHVPSLGIHACRGEKTNSRAWKWFTTVTEAPRFLLTQMIVTGNLVLAVLALLAVAVSGFWKIDPSVRAPVAAVLWGVSLLLGGASLPLQRPLKFPLLGLFVYPGNLNPDRCVHAYSSR